MLPYCWICIISLELSLADALIFEEYIGMIDNNTLQTTSGSGMSSTPSSETSHDSIKEQAKSYTAYHIGVALHKYYLPVVLVLGFTGNLCSLVVVIHTHFMSCCVLMTGLAVADSIVLYTMGHYWIISVGLGKGVSSGICKYIVYMFQCSSVASSYLITGVTINRFVAVCFPLKARAWNRVSRGKVVIVIICVASFISNIPHVFFGGDADDITCAAFIHISTLSKIYAWVNILIMCLLPVITIVILNMFIVLTLRRQNNFVDSSRKISFNLNDNISSVPTTISQSTQTIKAHQMLVDESSKTEQQLTIMLLTVSLLFLVFTMPQSIRFIVFQFIDKERNAETFATYTLLVHMTNKLFSTNSAINFYIYCLTGSKFRRYAQSLFMPCCICKEKKLPHNITSH